MAARKRTTMRSRTGTKLYAERDAQGEFTDIQTYKRAHGQDVKRVSKAETAARKAAGKPARKTGAAARKSAAGRKAASGRKTTGAVTILKRHLERADHPIDVDLTATVGDRKLTSHKRLAPPWC